MKKVAMAMRTELTVVPRAGAAPALSEKEGQVVLSICIDKKAQGRRGESINGRRNERNGDDECNAPADLQDNTHSHSSVSDPAQAPARSLRSSAPLHHVEKERRVTIQDQRTDEFPHPPQFSHDTSAKSTTQLPKSS